MRSLYEILEATKAGEKPDYDELRYALLAMAALSVFDSMALMRIATDYRDGKTSNYLTPWKRYEESFNRRKVALDKSPKEFLGSANDPDSPEYQERRRSSLRIYNNIIARIEGSKP